MNSSQRLWDKIDVGNANDCWKWKASLRQGYGNFRLNNKMVFAHRVVYELVNGPIPEGMHVLHACDEPLCCNPAHLHLGTHAQNMREMAIRGRAASGERIKNAKLTADQVREIRKMYALGGWSYQGLANVFGVSYVQISSIVRNKAWTHIT